MFKQIKRSYKHFTIINSIGIMATILVLVLIIQLDTYQSAYSATSPSRYDDIWYQIESQLPSVVPSLNSDWFADTDNLNDDESESQPAQLAATTSGTSCKATLSDKFDYPLYSLRDGQTSPNGKWLDVYNGYGSSGVESSFPRVNFWLSPKVSTSPSETHAAFVKSKDTFCNFAMTFDINTVKQLRKNSPANTWEVGWLFFRYVDGTHHYYLLVKPNGIELGKKDCDRCKVPVEGDQVYLVTKSSPKLKMNTWNKAQVFMVGNHIKVNWNGDVVIDYVDKTMSSKLASGSVGMYTEDAYVKFDNMVVSPR